MALGEGREGGRGPLQPVCQGNISQRPAPQHPHLEQGPGGDPEAGAGGGPPLSNPDHQPTAQLLPGSLHHLGKRLGSPLVRPDTSPTTTPNIQERWPLDGRMQLVEEEQVTLALQDVSNPLGCSASLILKLFS